MVCSWCEKKGNTFQHTIISCQSKDAGELCARQQKEINREKDKNLKKLQTRVDELEEEREKLQTIVNELVYEKAKKAKNDVLDIPKFHPVIVAPSNDVKKPDIEVIIKKLELDIQEKIISELEKETPKIFEKYHVDDPSDIILDELTNKFPEEKFEHSNGSVNISNMMTVLTTKYISKLFTGDVKNDIRRNFRKILTSFKRDDGFE